MLVDIQHEKLYWENERAGMCLCMSLIELQSAKDDQLAPAGSEDALHAIADEMGHDVVGFAGGAGRSLSLRRRAPLFQFQQQAGRPN